jgi:hypothetical protein
VREREREKEERGDKRTRERNKGGRRLSIRIEGKQKRPAK